MNNYTQQLNIKIAAILTDIGNDLEKIYKSNSKKQLFEKHFSITLLNEIYSFFENLSAENDKAITDFILSAEDFTYHDLYRKYMKSEYDIQSDLKEIFEYNFI